MAADGHFVDSREDEMIVVDSTRNCRASTRATAGGTTPRHATAILVSWVCYYFVCRDLLQQQLQAHHHVEEYRKEIKKVEQMVTQFAAVALETTERRDDNYAGLLTQSSVAQRLRHQQDLSVHP